jgi:hypothetical protein
MPKTKAFAPDYFIAQTPLRGQAGAEGHAVRAMYLYSALADVGDRGEFPLRRRS